MAITDLPGVPDTAPITRPAKVHYPACYLGPAYYLGRPAAQYLAVYSRGKPTALDSPNSPAPARMPGS